MASRNESGNTAADRRRLAWQCRRGMRELDELLIGFFLQRYETLDPAGRRTLGLLLEYPDSVLLEMLMGRLMPADRDVADLVREIRRTTRT
jgi:antitoxin CptB